MDQRKTTAIQLERKQTAVYFFYTHTQHQSSEKTTSLKNVNQRKKEHDLHTERQFRKNNRLPQGLDPMLSKTENTEHTTILEGLSILTDTYSHKEKT